ncbi:hypothetical protein [Hyphococcus sp.]|uniref:hypothetical protein n=1 Tax=Hyphococcus sp. TaxID=2038636 RepID=UPI002081C862|nr:MAG: hypothetical protein DHS20C04_04010 [Marinicaulis sp.]
MTVVQKIDRRGAQRFQASFNIRFSVNGGPEILSNTLNFTSRSLAIRSETAASIGDRIAIKFGGLPTIEGEVARVFPEGFAVVLSDASLAMMAHTHEPSQTSTQSLGYTGDTISSPMIRPSSKSPARIVITSSLDGEPGFTRHFLTIVTADQDTLKNVSAIWISADQTRWTANALRFEQRRNRSLAVMALNDWQAHMGAAYGLKVSIINKDMNEWTLEIAADHFAEQLENLTAQEEFKIAVNA